MMQYNITYRQKDKGWQFIISYKVDGKWKQKSKQGFKTKKDAKPFAEQILNELKEEIKNEKSVLNDSYKTITFKTLSDAFIAHSKLYREHSTIRGYKNALSNFSDLNNKTIKEIKKMDITSCVDKLIPTLKTETIKSYLLRIKLVFLYYIENYDPHYTNPIQAIKLPKDTTETNKKALTKSEVEKLLKKLEGTKFYIVAYIAANTGLRCGEILGLTWDDLNKKELTISVNKQWKILKNGTIGYGTLKSKNSNRKVPITSNMLKELERYKLSTPISIDNRIAPFNKASIEKYLNPKLRELADISIHELRHTYATLLIANGIDFKTAAKLLGHTVEMTLRKYSHVTDDMMKNASYKISKIF